jgi:O-antigen ligase
MPIWKENLQLIKVYPLTGCGLGCRRSAYLAYKTHQPLYSIDYGHSDYMQALIELGIPGFLIALGAAGSIFREVFRAARTRNNRAATYLALASLGAMAAMALHAFVDFNLHQPSNMLTLAWVAGLGSATSVAPAHREHTDRPVIDLVRID